LFGHGNNKTKVGFNEAVQRALVALADAHRQLNFFFGCDQVHFSDFLQVFFKTLRFTIGNRFRDLELTHTHSWQVLVVLFVLVLTFLWGERSGVTFPISSNLGFFRMPTK
jgi:hypothetical protein